jgi:hypothetical protein
LKIDLGLFHERKEQQCLTRIDEALDAIRVDEMTLMRDLETQCGSLYDNEIYGL